MGHPHTQTPRGTPPTEAPRGVPPAQAPTGRPTHLGPHRVAHPIRPQGRPRARPPGTRCPSSRGPPPGEAPSHLGTGTHRFCSHRVRSGQGRGPTPMVQGVTPRLRGAPTPRPAGRAAASHPQPRGAAGLPSGPAKPGARGANPDGSARLGPARLSPTPSASPTGCPGPSVAKASHLSSSPGTLPSRTLTGGTNRSPCPGSWGAGGPAGQHIGRRRSGRVTRGPRFSPRWTSELRLGGRGPGSCRCHLLLLALCPWLPPRGQDGGHPRPEERGYRGPGAREAVGSAPPRRDSGLRRGSLGRGAAYRPRRCGRPRASSRALVPPRCEPLS